MNININKLISELQARRESHQKRQNSKHTIYDEYAISFGRKSECDFLIQKLVALKNEQPEAITDDAHFRKHEVRRSADSEEISDKGNDPGAASSETQTVCGSLVQWQILPYAPALPLLA